MTDVNTSTSAATSAVSGRKTGIVTFLLDRSYSMLRIKAATLEGFNGYLSGLQEEDDADIDFTLLQFDDQSIDKVHVGVPVKQAHLLNESTFVPRGSTPLIEAAVKMIQAVDEALKTRTDNPRVTICIQTDGQENSSGREYTKEGLKLLIEEKRALGWEFNFLGSGIDVYATAGQYGIPLTSAMSYDADDFVATRNAFRATSSNSASFASGRVTSTAYSAADRLASGDKYWGNNAAPPPPQPAAKPAKVASQMPPAATGRGSGSRVKPIKL